MGERISAAPGSNLFPAPTVEAIAVAIGSSLPRVTLERLPWRHGERQRITESIIQAAGPDVALLNADP